MDLIWKALAIGLANTIQGVLFVVLFFGLVHIANSESTPKFQLKDNPSGRPPPKVKKKPIKPSKLPGPPRIPVPKFDGLKRPSKLPTLHR